LKIDERYLPPKGVRIGSIEKLLNTLKKKDYHISDCIVEIGQTPYYTLFAITEVASRKIINIS